MKKTIRRFTVKEQLRLIELRNRGYYFKQIAEILGRSVSTVVSKYHQLVNRNYRFSKFAPDYKFRLTEQEKVVADYMCRGLTDEQIAQKMIISVTTVRSHKNNIYSKYQVSGSNARTKCVLRHLGYEVEE